MQTLYELTTLKTVIFGAGKAAPALEKWLSEGSGHLKGAWFSDIGNLNEVYLLRSFDNHADLFAERERTYRSENPFGCLELLLDYQSETCRSLDFMPELALGDLGPVYEIRTYHLKLDGLLPTLEKWEKALPERNAYSPCICALYALEGSPRLTQIWPYPSLEARADARGQSVKDGKWPPQGGPDWLKPDMRSTIAMPMGFSPLK